MTTAVKMGVPFLDIKQQNRRIWPELQQALDGVTSQAQFILGPAVERFEEGLRRLSGPHALCGPEQRHLGPAHGPAGVRRGAGR